MRDQGSTQPAFLEFSKRPSILQTCFHQPHAILAVAEDVFFFGPLKLFVKPFKPQCCHFLAFRFVIFIVNLF